MDDIDLLSMTKTEKEALCYRLLVTRDGINEELRKVQASIKEETDGQSISKG